MIWFFNINNFKRPKLDDFTLKRYSVNLSLDRLVLGTDNIRYDAHLSEEFCSSAGNIVTRLIGKYANSEHILQKHKGDNWIQTRDKFKRLYREIMISAVNKAKMAREIQIDYLAEIAVTKFLIGLLHEQFEVFADNFKEVIRVHEISEQENPIKSIVLKEQLNTTLQQKRNILFKVGKELFGYLSEIKTKDINEVREANFGVDAILPADVFVNPMLLVENPFYDFFMIEEYDILLGHRLEDPNKYDILLNALRNIINKYITTPRKILKDNTEQIKNVAGDNVDSSGVHLSKKYGLEDGWISHVDNVDVLLNYFKTQEQYALRKKQKVNSKDLKKIKKYLATQKRMLSIIYNKLGKTGLIQRISAYYEIKSVYQNYCPPLNPQQVLQFLFSRKQRKRISNQVKQLEGYYEKPLILKPLFEKIKKLERIKNKKKKKYLIQFLKGFFRFHRDHVNLNLVKEIMENVNIVLDEKVLNLSRANNTLYEFLLSHEEAIVEKPVTSHVIIKADVRGSTDITYRMRENGLNPASYFSMNFFDPITDILSTYDAEKIFIEGDAVILAIHEQKDNPGAGYSVARACGLAANILAIVNRYNINSSKYNLPILELGIGISSQNGAPAFLFDGDQRIMITPAINSADRLSACAKILRNTPQLNKSMFNLHLFTESAKTGSSIHREKTYLRYNLNGIELDKEGFKKLSEEIDLKALEYKTGNEKLTLYTGRYPTAFGKFQRLIIREGRIAEIRPADLQITGLTRQTYYEVCTHPKIYEYVKNKT